MGASESHEDLCVVEARELASLEEEAKNTDDLQDLRYPWFQIIQWACETLPSKTVFKWNYDDIRQEAYALTTSATVQRHEATGKAGPRENASLDLTPTDFLYNCPPCELENFNFDNNDCAYVEWAAALLVRIPSLNRLRYTLVPKRLSEDEFWRRYFGALKKIVRNHVQNQATNYDEDSPTESRPEGHQRRSDFIGKSPQFVSGQAYPDMPVFLPPPLGQQELKEDGIGRPAVF